jgi:hypothetical protein
MFPFWSDASGVKMLPLGEINFTGTPELTLSPVPDLKMVPPIKKLPWHSRQLPPGLCSVESSITAERNTGRINRKIGWMIMMEIHILFIAKAIYRRCEYFHV